MFRKYFILGINLLVLGLLVSVMYNGSLGGLVGYVILAYLLFAFIFNLYAFIVYVIMQKFYANTTRYQLIFCTLLLVPIGLICCYLLSNRA